ncbi:ATP-binding protein [Pseudolysobacter antarcticus]|nr:ATP-binding protein [Pseudolysobacter antarcticus]
MNAPIRRALTMPLSKHFPASYLHLGPSELLASLAWLRLCAIVGQALTVAFVAHWLVLPIPENALWRGIAVLLLFEVLVLWRMRRTWPVNELEVFGHFVVDMGVLAYLLYLTGGSTNPFISLLVVPIALAATTLAARYLIAIALFAGIIYATLMLYHLSLPSMYEHDMHADFGLHVLGMAANFAITGFLLGLFIWRLARALRQQQTQMQRERERALRDEGILAIATQAAGAAHELNTPLSTIRTLLGELRRAPVDAATLSEDLDVLQSQADRCRDILRELVAVGSAQLADTPETLDLEEFIAGCAERFRLLRPEIELQIDIAAEIATIRLSVLPGLRHALINLLNNAADASQQQSSARVDLVVRGQASILELRVRDYGIGLSADILAAAGHDFYSSKRNGLGLGLALTHATAERLNGELSVHAAAGGGSETCLRLPLRLAENR